MLKAGIAEARQHLSRLLDQVAKGREVTITDRGRPVARLVSPVSESRLAFKDPSQLRRTVRLRGKPLSKTIADDRDDRA